VKEGAIKAEKKARAEATIKGGEKGMTSISSS